MAITVKEDVTLGAGELYVVEYSGTAIPEDATIEADTNKVGHISQGASVEYKAEWKEVENAKGQAVKTFITKEDVRFKSGILSWNGKTLAKMCQTAKVIDDDTKKLRIVRIGGKGNYTAQNYVIRFVHTKDNGKKIRFTIVGKNQAGFSLAFDKEKETVIDAEFKAFAQDDAGTLLMLSEEADV